MTLPIPDNEEQRLEALKSYDILDTLQEKSYDDFTYLASQICAAPIALISLIDEDRQWFKSRAGLDVEETPRALAFCAHAIMGSETLVVEDALKDQRFSQNQLVQSEPKIRFYAGAPLFTPEGYTLGTLCTIDQRPRKLSLNQIWSLEALARQVMTLMNLRITSNKLSKSTEDNKRLSALIPVCSCCKKIRHDEEFRLSMETFLNDYPDLKLSAEVCPDCRN